ncbi:hypothetical protein LguiA_002155 [Lonicera macranthoides]
MLVYLSITRGAMLGDSFLDRSYIKKKANNIPPKMKPSFLPLSYGIMDAVKTSVARCTFRSNTLAMYIQEHSSFQQLQNDIKSLVSEIDLSGLYPIAFTIVDNESEDSWNWFAERLHHILHGDERRITFMSDRNIGLINAIREWFPGHPHAFCFHHLRNNIEAKFPGTNNRDTREKVIELFTSCAYTLLKKRFHKKLEELKKEGGDVIKSFLGVLPLENWANSYFPGERYGEMCSNIVESFNSMLVEERKLPIT